MTSLQPAISSPVLLNHLVRSVKTSSVWSSSREFAGFHMLEVENLESCWMSGPGQQNGNTQAIALKFSAPAIISHIRFHFQGGFAPRLIDFSDSRKLVSLQPVFHSWEPQDNNTKQTCKLPTPVRVSSLNLAIPTSYDHDYGRVTIYSLEIFGFPAEGEKAGEENEKIQKESENTTQDEKKDEKSSIVS